MTAVPISQETYLPDTDSDVARLYDFLAAHEEAGRGTPELRYFLAGATPGEQVELPQETYRVLRQVIEAMHQGLAVTVVPQSKMLTSQQAADLLGVSRPTVIKLLDGGKIPFERTGTHRRILLRDVLAYRAQRRRDQYAALEAMAADTVEEGDPETVLEQLRTARRAVAARRRNRPQS
ncbi:DNA binding domain-containing protein, excisionase family [Modestobacter sp. DSM 44400]|uniref:helix-turn-helix domain-containing protein n=1 Tax=Modestobacter sp. DSM 44400 TaxID=1550230 RepID=UPI0008987FCE|nr:helix-turn-helix domain-containing protein [Modestobacter sp. DSM 44400]SDY86075.1 DNA binding domain-containing protein, excisionase family [Modestobacter sp. DSM 44400]